MIPDTPDTPEALLRALYDAEEAIVVTDPETGAICLASADLWPAPPFWVRAQGEGGTAVFVAISFGDVVEEAVEGTLASLALAPSFTLIAPSETSGKYDIHALYKLPRYQDSSLVAGGLGQLGWSVRLLYPAPGTRGCWMAGGTGRVYTIGRLRKAFRELCC